MNDTHFHYSGGWLGFVSYMIRFPTERFSIICLCNRNDIQPWHLAREVADISLQEAFTEPKHHVDHSPEVYIDVPVTQLASRVGFYENSARRKVWHVRLEGESLVAEDDYSRFILRPVSTDKFHTVDTHYVTRFKFEERSSDGRSTLRVERIGLDFYLEPKEWDKITLEAAREFADVWQGQGVGKQGASRSQTFVVVGTRHLEIWRSCL